MPSGNQAAIRLVVSTMWGFERLAWFTERSGTYARRGSALLARSLLRLSGGVMLRSLSVAPYARSNRRPRAGILVPAAVCLAGDRKDAADSAPAGKKRQPLTGSQYQNVIGDVQSAIGCARTDLRLASRTFVPRRMAARSGVSRTGRRPPISCWPDLGRVRRVQLRRATELLAIEPVAIDGAPDTTLSGAAVSVAFSSRHIVPTHYIWVTGMARHRRAPSRSPQF
jgi:hypothetical protein